MGAPVLLGDWADGGLDALKSDFDLGDAGLNGCEVLLAYYSAEGYEGTAFVLFRRDGELYEVHGSHCSCYGLEGQWEPEVVDLDEMWHRLNEGACGKGEWADELKPIIASLLGK